MSVDDEMRKFTLRLEAVAHRIAASQCDMVVAMIDATTSIGRFTDIMRGVQEAAFLEMVVRYDEPADPAPRPWKRNARRFVR